MSDIADLITIVLFVLAIIRWIHRNWNTIVYYLKLITICIVFYVLIVVQDINLKSQ